MSTTTVRVHYIRHGESQWNAEQQAARRRGVSESFVRTLAAEPRFTDSPLSETGVRQAISLRARLMEGSDGLAAALRCAADGSCAAPTLIVSNLRRAVDTGLLALRHLLDAREDLRVAVLPALQESCHYADCGPLPLAAGLRLEPPVISAAAAIEAARESAEAAMRHVVGTAEAHEEAEAEEALSRATRHSVVGTVLAAQASLARLARRSLGDLSATSRRPPLAVRSASLAAAARPQPSAPLGEKCCPRGARSARPASPPPSPLPSPISAIPPFLSTPHSRHRHAPSPRAAAPTRRG